MRYRSRVGHWLDRVLSGGLGKQLLIYAGVVLVLFLLLWGIAVLIHIPIQSEKAEGFGDFWTMLFFFYDGGLEGTLPNNRWFVYLVNLLGSIVMGGILIAAITNFLQNHTTKAEEGLLRYRMKNHSVFIGLDDSIIPLLNSCVEQNRDAVILSEETASVVRMKLGKSLSQNRRNRIVVYHGERTDVKEITALNVAEAEEVFILPNPLSSDSDSQNLDVVKTIAYICNEKERKGLKCTVVFKEDTVVTCFERSDVDESVKKNLVFNPVIYSDSIARALLSGHVYGNGFLDREPITADSSKYIDLFIFGLGEMGCGLFRQAVRQLHFPNFEGVKSRITLIGFEQDIISLKAKYCEFFDVAESASNKSLLDISLHSISETDFPGIESALNNAISNTDSLVTIVVCSEDPSQALKQTVSLPKAVFELGVPVWVYKPDSRSLTDLIRKNSFYSNVVVFGENDGLFSDEDSLLTAQRINWVYSVFSETKKIPTGLPSEEEWIHRWVPAWESLSIAKKWSNLHHADSIPIKLRSIGINSSTKMDLTEDQIQLLAKVEHNRWVAETLLAGYRPPTDQERRDAIIDRRLKDMLKDKLVHLDLCAYGDLLEDMDGVDVKDFDKVIETCIPLMIQD